jgi:hypothetical protein
MKRKLTKGWPQWVRMSLLGIQTREGALLYVWCMAAFSVVAVIGGLLFGAIAYSKGFAMGGPVFWLIWGLYGFYGAPVLWLAIKWVDEHGGWPQTSASATIAA